MSMTKAAADGRGWSFMLGDKLKMKSCIVVMILCLLAGAAQAAETERPYGWAAPVTLAGVPNLHKVSDSLYRSAQPTKGGMKEVAKLGIRTVVNLRSFHSDRDELKGLPVDYEHITMKAWHPERKEIVRFLRIVTDPKRTPVLVHCRHGADRTGTMCAVYRIVVQGWSKEDAVREMTQGGYGFHEVWGNLPGWIERIDVEGIKKELSKE